MLAHQVETITPLSVVRDMGGTMSEALEMLELMRQISKNVDSLGDRVQPLEANSADIRASLATVGAQVTELARRMERADSTHADHAKQLTSLQIRLSVIAVGAGASAGAVAQGVASLIGG